MYKGRAHLVLILGLGLAGCLTPAAQKQKPQDVTAGPTRPKPVAIYEEDTSTVKIQPTTGDTLMAAVPADTAHKVKRDTASGISAKGDTMKIMTPAFVLRDSPGVKEVEPPLKTIPGFRVQVFASTSRGNAERVFSEARGLLREKAYLEVVPPLFKVRMGNCLTQQEALLLKDRAIEKGYKSAFVVETDIEL